MRPVNEKVCSVCGESKSLHEYHRHVGGHLGTRPECKVCRKTIANLYYQKNKEHLKAQTIKYKADNRAKVVIQNALYRKAKKGK